MAITQTQVTQVKPKQLELTQADVLAPQVVEPVAVALEPKLASGIAAAIPPEPVALASAMEPALASGIAAATTATPIQPQIDSDPDNDTVYDVVTGREYASPIIATRLGVKNYTTTKPVNPFAAELAGGVQPLNDYLSGLNQYSSKFVEVRNALDKYPEIASAIKTLYDIDPNHFMFQGDGNVLQTSITSLQQEIDAKGLDKALRNFYKDQQSLVGFGGDDWAGSRNMGNESYANLQKKAMGFTPMADQATWKETASNTLGSREELAALWRDPISGLGIGVLKNGGKPSSLVYFDRSGQSLRSSIMNPADLYENAERYGIDLSNIGQLEDSLKSSGYDISPYKLYGPTSDGGVDLSGVAQGEGLLDMATDEWLQRQFAHFDWQDREARKAGFNYNNTNVAREKAIQNNQMAKRMLGQFGLDAPPVAPTAAGGITLPDVSSLSSPSLVGALGVAQADAGDPLRTLYQDVLGREATPEELASWNFGSEVDAGELDRFLGAARNEAVNTMPTTGNVGKLAQQILSQDTASKWSGEGFGSAEKNAYDMAALLAGQGLTDINQLGVRTRVVPESYSYSGTGGADTGMGELIPAHEVNEYYNKATGQPIQSYYDKASGNTWGGTFAGEGSTAYKVQFQPDGTPTFYTQYGGSSNDFANLMADLGPVAQLGLGVATGGMTLPYALATQFAVQVLGGADPQDALKGAALSYGLSQLPGLDVVKEGMAYLNSIDPSGVLASSLTKAATSGISAAATGQDVSNAMLSGAVSGGVSGAINAALKQPEFSGMSASEKRIAANAMGGVLSGKPLDQVLLNAAVSAAREATKGATTKTTSSAATPAPVEDMGPTSYGTNVTKQLTDAGLIDSSGQFADAGSLTDADIAEIAGGADGDILAGGSGGDTVFAQSGNGTATDAGGGGSTAKFADIKQGISGYLSGSVGENTGIARRNDGSYGVYDPSNSRVLLFSSDGTYMGAPAYSSTGGETTTQIAQDFINAFTNSPYAKSFTGTAVVDGSDVGANTGATSGSTATDLDGSFWEAIGIDPSTTTSGDSGLSNDEIMALVGYGESANPPKDGSGKPVFGSVTGTFGGGVFPGNFSLVSEEGGSQVYENEGFTLVARADGTSFAVDKNDPNAEPIWFDFPQTQQILSGQTGSIADGSTTVGTAGEGVIVGTTAGGGSTGGGSSGNNLTIVSTDSSNSTATGIDVNGEIVVINNPGGSLTVGDSVAAGGAGSGSGSSAGAGAGSGSGAGTGTGSGAGAGAGSGTGGGDGSGAGSGNGTGAGTGGGGSGTGTGTGSGDGSGTGSGTGTGGEGTGTEGGGTGAGGGGGSGGGGGGAGGGGAAADAKEQIALTINQPASSPIVQDIFEALYGTMEYLDISEEFSPSERKASPAATQKQQQQTKMAQGGYLDDLLAENMSVDDLLNLLR